MLCWIMLSLQTKKWHRFLENVLWFVLLRLVTQRFSLSTCTDNLHIAIYIFSVFIFLCNS